MFASDYSLPRVRLFAYFTTAVVTAMLFLLSASSTLAAVPLVAATTNDSDANGTVDRVVLTFSALVDINDGNAADGFTSIVLNSGCTIANADYANTSTLTLTLVVTGCTAGNTAITPTVSYTQVANCATPGSICDDAGDTDQMATATPNATATDGAKPILLTSTPVTNATSIRKTGVVTLNFSEAVTFASFDYTLTPATSTQVVSPTSGSAATFTLTGTKHSGANVLTVVAATDVAGNVLNTANSVYTGNALRFRVASSATVEAVEEAPTYSVHVDAPNGGEMLVPGAVQEITWTATSSNEALTAVTILYSTDGENWTTIVTNTANDGSYLWSLPDEDAAEVWVKVVGTDLVEILAIDTSDATFMIGDDSAMEDEDSSEHTDADEHSDDGVSPVTGEVESVSGIAYGDYIMSPSYDTVYYIDYATDGETLVRRPFLDAQTFKTWQDDFDNVMTVTDATLPTVSLGAPMLPKSGVVLVKIQSVDKVYAVHGDGMLHWVASEAIAVDVYGSNWADYVIDISDTLYPRFDMGDDLEMGDAMDMDIMKTRAEVNS